MSDGHDNATDHGFICYGNSLYEVRGEMLRPLATSSVDGRVAVWPLARLAGWSHIGWLAADFASRTLSPTPLDAVAKAASRCDKPDYWNGMKNLISEPDTPFVIGG